MERCIAAIKEHQRRSILYTDKPMSIKEECGSLDNFLQALKKTNRPAYDVFILGDKAIFMWKRGVY